MDSFMFAPVGKLEEEGRDGDLLFASHDWKSIAAAIARGNVITRFPSHPIVR
jgi:hypothetical protein